MSARNEAGSLPDDGQRPSPATGVSIPASHAPVAPAPRRWFAGPFVRLLATNMAIGFSLSCFYLLPKHLTVAYAASPGQVGAVVGVFGLTCVVAVPWLGRAVSALGLARTLVLGLLLLAACAFAFALPATIGPAMLLLRALQGLATAGVMTASVAMVCELAPAENLGQAMGLAGAAGMMMNAVAPAVAEPLSAHYGFAWVFVLAGVAALLGVLGARRLPGRARPRVVSPPVPLTRHGIAVLVVLAFSAAGFHVVMAFLAPLALGRGISAVKGFFVAYTVAALSVRIFGGPFTDRLGLRRTAALGLLVYGAFIAGVAALGPRSLVGLGLGFGLAHGALFPALMGLLFEATQESERIKLAAFANGVMNLGMLSVLGFGQMANHAGLVAVFLVTGAMVAASSLLLRPDRLQRPTLLRGVMTLWGRE
jgi:MFS family permease